MRIVVCIAVMGILSFTGPAALALPPAPAPNLSLNMEPSPRTFLLDAPGPATGRDVRSGLFLDQEATPHSLPSAPERVAHRKTADLSFWSVTGLMVAATVANAQAYVNCGNCTALPSSFHRSGTLYGVGLPLDVGFACVGYYLKKHDHRWWFAPGAAFAGGNTYLAYHWASRTQ